MLHFFRDLINLVINIFETAKRKSKINSTFFDGIEDGENYDWAPVKESKGSVKLPTNTKQNQLIDRFLKVEFKMPEPTHEEIAVLAYEKWKTAQPSNKSSEDFWLEAENELKGNKNLITRC